MACHRGCRGGHFDDPAGTDPVLLDGLWGRYRSAEAFGFGMQPPGDGAGVADRVINSHKSNLVLSLELAADLAVEGLLVCLDRQVDFDSMLLQLPKNVFWVCRESGWISTPSRSSSPN